MITMFASSMDKSPLLIYLIADRYAGVKNRLNVSHGFTVQAGHLSSCQAYVDAQNDRPRLAHEPGVTELRGSSDFSIHKNTGQRMRSAKKKKTKPPSR
jgi:hypothetical protein